MEIETATAQPIPPKSKKTKKRKAEDTAPPSNPGNFDISANFIAFEADSLQDQPKKKNKKDAQAENGTANGLISDVGTTGKAARKAKRLEDKKRTQEEKRAKKAKKVKSATGEESAVAVEPPSSSLPASAAPPILDDEAATIALKEERKRRKREKKAAKAAAIEQTTAPVPSVLPTPCSTSTSTPTPGALTPVPAEAAAFLASHGITYEPETALSSYPPALSFGDIDVSDKVKAGLSQFTKPTPIQSAVWPVLMGGRDVIGIAETGSGKTLGFGVPAIQHILSLPKSSSRNICCLVVAPTRELAMQTHANLAELGNHISPPVKSVCVYGGVDKNAQKKSLSDKHVKVVVGTPGRLLDLAGDGSLDLGKVSWLVLDEADRMLDKGFENDIRRIIALCLPFATSAAPFKFGAPPTSRLTAMFSATWPMSVRRLAADFMFNPVRVLVGADELTASTSIEQTVHVLRDGREKDGKILDTLRELGDLGRPGKGGKGALRDKCLIFALYKKEAQRIFQNLQWKGFEVGCIEGDMSQDKRSQALDDFRNGKTGLLVATDVAARGLDIPAVQAVLNVTFPLTIEDYIHRIGRTGRAGKTGKAITFFTEVDKAHAGELMRVLKDANQTVPDDLGQWGTTIKKKSHSAFGAHFKDVDLTQKGKKITFE